MARGNGVGTFVFRELTKKVEQMDLKPSLEVRMSNTAARKVYRNLGFINTIQKGDVMIMEKRWV
jgi:ribosomal protein S18 acetylase RimI-like enzyme